MELKLLQDNIAIPARLVSEGTLRILGLLAMGGIKDSPALLGFEEPETGIHPRQMRAILLTETLRERQVIRNLYQSGRYPVNRNNPLANFTGSSPGRLPLSL